MSGISYEFLIYSDETKDVEGRLTPYLLFTQIAPGWQNFNPLLRIHLKLTPQVQFYNLDARELRAAPFDMCQSFWAKIICSDWYACPLEFLISTLGNGMSRDNLVYTVWDKHVYILYNGPKH